MLGIIGLIYKRGVFFWCIESPQRQAQLRDLPAAATAPRPGRPLAGPYLRTRTCVWAVWNRAPLLHRSRAVAPTLTAGNQGWPGRAESWSRDSPLLLLHRSVMTAAHVTAPSGCDGAWLRPFFQTSRGLNLVMWVACPRGRSLPCSARHPLVTLLITSPCHVSDHVPLVTILITSLRPRFKSLWTPPHPPRHFRLPRPSFDKSLSSPEHVSRPVTRPGPPTNPPPAYCFKTQRREKRRRLPFLRGQASSRTLEPPVPPCGAGPGAEGRAPAAPRWRRALGGVCSGNDAVAAARAGGLGSQRRQPLVVDAVL